MEPGQIILYSILLLLVGLYVRRMLLLRSVKNYTPKEVAERLKAGSIVLVDVRTAGERSSSSIKGSIHVPLQELRKRAGELEKHKNHEIVCYCAAGSRSISAAATLQKLGFKSANMRGGIGAWNFSGMNS